MSRSGSNIITGTAGSEHLNGGSGADIINGMGGNDRINAGSGNDIIDGGSGNDIVNGDSGDDLGIYVLSENIGSTDVYDGGSGRDTLQLVLTRAQWQSPAVQADIARFLTFLAEVTNPVNGQATNANFTFSFGLTVSKFEALKVVVDGIELDPRNEAVTLVNDVIFATEDTASVSVDVLFNDSVPDLIKALSNTQPEFGTVTLTQTSGAPGVPDTASFVYTPSATHWQYLAAGETATDTFTYTVTDSDGDTRTATVTVTITGTNDGPVAVADAATAVEDGGAVNIAVLANDTDVDAGDTKSVVSLNTAGTVGSVSVNTDGSLSYNPGASFQHLGAGETAVDSFTYTMQDASGATSTATVNVTVNGVNDAPAALDDNRSTNEDSSITINVLANDSDVDGDALTLAGLSGATSALGASISIVNGQVVYNAASSATLNAMNTGQFATDSFTYTVSDGVTTTTATVTVNVAGVSDSGAVNDTVATGEDNRIYIDVLANDTSSNGKTIVGLNGTSNGTATTALGAEIQIFNGQIFYNPQNAAGIQALNSGQTAVDTFTYTMRDGNGTLSQATVTVNVAGFTEGTIINSGVTATVTFNNASPWATPQSYSEAGITVQSLYNPNSSPHLHFSNNFGDPTVELYNHSGCCSTPYEFRYFNPANGDTTFSLQNFNHFGGGGTWTSSTGGSIVVTGQGPIDFSSNPLFTNVEWIRWDPISSSDYIDNLTYTA